MLRTWSHRRVHRNFNDANDDPLDQPEDVVMQQEVTHETRTQDSALSQPCPVRWCNAAAGEDCWDQHVDVAVPPHSPRRALVGWS
jgi:hypothetical protein